MTKDEFYESVTTFSALVDFCNDNGCYYIVEDFKHVDDFDDWFWDCVEALRSRWYWHDLCDKIADFSGPSGDYFIPTGDLEYKDLCDDWDLDEYLDEVISWGDDDGFWDEEDDDEEYNDDGSDRCWDEAVQDEPSFTSDIEIAMFIGVA